MTVCLRSDTRYRELLEGETLEGETLSDRVVKGPLPPGQGLKYGIEICEGLEKRKRIAVASLKGIARALPGKQEKFGNRRLFGPPLSAPLP